MSDVILKGLTVIQDAVDKMSPEEVTLRFELSQYRKEIQQLKQQLEAVEKENRGLKMMLNHVAGVEHVCEDLEVKLAEAVEVIEFYGNHTNWETEILSKRACYKKVFKDCDIERVKVMVGYVDSCGKRARQFLAKYREEK